MAFTLGPEIDALILTLKTEERLTWQAVAKKLNRKGLRTVRAKRWTGVTIRAYAQDAKLSIPKNLQGKGWKKVSVLARTSRPVRPVRAKRTQSTKQLDMCTENAASAKVPERLAELLGSNLSLATKLHFLTQEVSR